MFIFSAFVGTVLGCRLLWSSWTVCSRLKFWRIFFFYFHFFFSYYYFFVRFSFAAGRVSLSMYIFIALALVLRLYERDSVAGNDNFHLSAHVKMEFGGATA